MTFPANDLSLTTTCGGKTESIRKQFSRCCRKAGFCKRNRLRRVWFHILCRHSDWSSPNGGRNKIRSLCVSCYCQAAYPSPSISKCPEIRRSGLTLIKICCLGRTTPILRRFSLCWKWDAELDWHGQKSCNFGAEARTVGTAHQTRKKSIIYNYIGLYFTLETCCVSY